MTQRTIVFATNAHKLEEIRRTAGDSLDIVGLADIGCHEDIPETAPTLLGNARQKARWVSERYGVDCFADDTGLMVDALDGAPGVYSARFAGPGHDSAANMARLLSLMEGQTDRRARFVTEIVLILGGEEHRFTGAVEGEILSAPVGEEGFGYDPVFFVPDKRKTFAQLSAEEKAEISHRGKALRAFKETLKNYLAEHQ